MRRGPRPARRAGFTLIELLVVVAILAILAALVAAGIGRVKTAAMSNATNQTLTKLQLALDKQWKAVCDECRDHRRTYSQPNKHPDFVKVVAICEDDVDRAEALWMHMNLRRSMPHSFYEATQPTILSGSDKVGNAVTVTLPPASTFKSVPARSVLGTLESDQNSEAAALLYIILTQGGRGTSFPIEDAMQGAQTSIDVYGAKLDAFKDAYGTPITFRRFYQSPTGELKNPPYSARGLKTITDPLDPVGRLNPNIWKPTNPKTSGNPAAAVKAVFLTPGVGQPSGTAPTFNGDNKVPTVISAGDDREFEAGLPGILDDAFGYRVTRQGVRGD